MTFLIKTYIHKCGILLVMAIHKWHCIYKHKFSHFYLLDMVGRDKKKYEKNCAWWIRCFPTTEFNERKNIKKHPLKMPNSIQYTLNNNSLYIYNFQQLRIFVPYFICVSFSISRYDVVAQNRTYIPIHNICFVWFAAIKCKVAFIVGDFSFLFFFALHSSYIIGFVLNANSYIVRH